MYEKMQYILTVAIEVYVTLLNIF